MINRYMVTQTLKVMEIFPCRVSEMDQPWLMLWTVLMFRRGEPVLRSKAHPGSCLSLSPRRVQQTAKASTLTETTLKQLEVLSEMLRLMSKPNKNSKRLKANIVDWTPFRCICKSISFWTAAKPNRDPEMRTREQTQICARTRSRARGNAIHTGLVFFSGPVLVFLCWSLSDVLGDAERQSGAWAPPLLLCLHWWFPDASQWSERYGTLGGQPSSLWARASRPGLRQLYLGYLKNTA